MAVNYHCNQFEKAFKPKCLRNWEVPNKCDEKPRKRSGRTQIISNDRGHLLPGVPKSKSGVWGNYLGTWQLPQKIDRKTANILNGTYTEKVPCKPRLAKLQDGHLQELAESTQEETKEQSAHEPQEAVEDEAREPGEQEKENVIPYTPGDLTDPKYALESHHWLKTKERVEEPRGYPRHREDFSMPVDQSNEPQSPVGEFCSKNEAMKMMVYNPEPEPKWRRKQSPIVAAIKNFQLAKKLHRENLEHDPLPDTVAHSKYKQLQVQRSEKDPGLALDAQPSVTGIGWKGYPGYGPTRCTKLKVYRPKTCGHVAKQDAGKNDERPNSVTSFDRKWRFIRARKVSPIELAICWDLTPENPKDEPKRPPHIDGSNGSLAPAVFTLVHTPKEDDSRKTSISSHESGAVFDKAPPLGVGEKDFVLDRPKTSQIRRTSLESIRSNTAKKRAKSAFNLESLEEERECVQCSVHHHQSTPNLSEAGAGRVCVACEKKNETSKEKKRKSKEEFKMAFKAGVPHKTKREDYPEHWRLASVYQHSYKPIHARKRPLLATVFK